MKNALLLVLLICGISTANSQPVSNPQKTEAKIAKPAAGTPDSPIFLKREKTQDEKDGDSQQEAREIKNLKLQADALQISEKSLQASEATLAETTKAANAAVWATVIAGFAAASALAAAIIAYYQWRMFARQLVFMKRGNIHASVGVRAAKQSADAAEVAANASKDAAKEAIESNKIAAASAIAEYRPWVSINARIAGDLLFDNTHIDEPTGDKRHIDIECVIKNIGKTPATCVSVSTRMVPFIRSSLPENLDEPPVGGTNVLNEINATCDLLEFFFKAKVGWGEIIFPDEEREMSENVICDQAAFIFAADNPDRYFGYFLITVCVTYGSTLDESHYRTCKAYALTFAIPQGKIPLDGERIAKERLNLRLEPHNGSQAT